MAFGHDDTDELAYALAQTDFDAVERDGYRAEWTDDGTEVRVHSLETEETARYNAEDLVRAESDREVSDAKVPE